MHGCYVRIIINLAYTKQTIQTQNTHKQIYLSGLVRNTDKQEFVHRFRKLIEVKLDMQVMHNRDAHPLPCNKTPFLVKPLEINNNMAILIHPEQANSTIAKKM